MNNKLVNVLADEGSFLPLSTASNCGISTGILTILSRPACVISIDQQVRCGAEKPMLQLTEKAVQTGTPLILLFSKTETVDASADIMSVVKALVRLSGVCPLIALIEKEAGDLAAALVPHVDFCIYAEGAHERSASVLQALDLPSAIEMIRTLLSYLPLNCAERAPLLIYNGHANLPAFTDPATAFSVYFDQSIRLEFARVNGRSIGLITASGVRLPAHTSRFIQFCDCYSLPIILIAESEASLDAQQTFLLSQATIPLIAIGEIGKYNALFDSAFSSGDGTRENIINALEYLSVKRDVLPPHKHGNMPL